VRATGLRSAADRLTISGLFEAFQRGVHSDPRDLQISAGRAYLDLSNARRPGREVQRVNVDSPSTCCAQSIEKRGASASRVKPSSNCGCRTLSSIRETFAAGDEKGRAARVRFSSETTVANFE
jgi:hypothetical protein